VIARALPSEGAKVAAVRNRDIRDRTVPVSPERKSAAEVAGRAAAADRVFARDDAGRIRGFWRCPAPISAAGRHGRIAGVSGETTAGAALHAGAACAGAARLPGPGRTFGRWFDRVPMPKRH
jgi:hypothetical protein